MRNALPDDRLLPKIAKLLPVLAQILDQQLRKIEHTPSRRRRLPASAMVQQAKAISAIVDGLETIAGFQRQIAAHAPPIDHDAKREKLERRIDDILAAVRRKKAGG